MERKEAIEIVRKLYNESLFLKKNKEAMVTLIPELKESEDEQHRKWILEYLYDGLRKSDEQFKDQFKCAIEWFEKQGEQKPVNKVKIGEKYRCCNSVRYTCFQIGKVYEVKDSFDAAMISLCSDFFVLVDDSVEQKPTNKIEPKFREGDWVVHNKANFVFKVVSVGSNGYEVVNRENYKKTISFDNDVNYHRWTIQDAKDGDVLCTYECGKPKIVFILEGAPKKPYVLGYHCFYNIMYPHFEFDSEKGCLAPNEEDVKPATKEQRDTLFTKMHEAGYEWDAEKKKLKKIEQESTWNDKTKDLNKVEEYILSLVPNRPLDAVKTDAKNIRFLVREEQKPAEWRITDEDMFRSAVWHIKNSISNGKPDTITKSDILDWFITLKERVQPRQEWSEEDKMHLDAAIHLASNTGHIETANWLESLKDRYTWKPSDLPHWKKSNLPNNSTTGFNSDYFCHKGYCINYKELFEKLPKDD